MVRYNLADDYYQNYADVVRNLNLKDISKAAKTIVLPQHINWIVVGDREQIEEKIAALGYGDIVIIDADGNIVE
jgi:hypothetical protein